VVSAAVRGYGGELQGGRALEDCQAHCRALVTLYLHLGKAGDDGQVHIVLLQVAAGDGNRLDGLVDGAGADRLDLRIALLAHDAGNSAGNCRRTGLRRDFD
jgi:hypothetical protein